MFNSSQNERRRKSRLLAVVVLFAVLLSVSCCTSYETKGSPDSEFVAEFEDFIIYGDTLSATSGLIFYPGGSVDEHAYWPLLTALSEQGICCVVARMPMDLAVFKVNAADKIISQLSSIDEWYIGGHSLGGAMASKYAASHQDELKGLIMIASYPAKTLGEDFPVLSILGSEDQVLNMDSYNKAKPKAKNLKQVVIDGGNHCQFGSYGFQKGDGEATITPENQQKQTADAILNFVRMM